MILLNAYEILLTRIETRDFADDQTIPDQVIQKVIEAGRLAPSAMNRQPWKFVIIRDREKLKKLAEINSHARYVEKSAFAVAIYIKESRFGEIDATRAITHMQLAAWMLTPRLGSCFNWGWDADQVASIIKPPEDIKLVTIIPFGYPRDPTILGKKSRKSWEDVVIEQ